MMQRASLRRVHSASGMFPLGAYLFFHAWEHWPVRDSRDALFARLGQTHHLWLESGFVLLPLLVHAGLGMALWRDPDGERVYVSPAFRVLQAVTGVLAAAFLAMHLVGAWLPCWSELNPIGAAYMSMRDQAGRLSGLVAHVLGLGAVCTHFGQGLGVALVRLSPEGIAPAIVRGLGVLVGILLWLVFLNSLAVYATAAPLL